MRAATLLFCLALTACTQFPQLEGTVAPDVENADFPDLVPLEPLLAAATPVVADPAQATRTLETRVGALRARAGALRRNAILAPDTRDRLRGSLE